MKKYQCPCCEYYTYNVPPNEDCGYICPVCFWENDPVQLNDPDFDGGANEMSLNEAREAYQKAKKEVK